MKKTIALLLAVLSLLSLTSCAAQVYKASPKTFTQNGMSMTLTEAFTPVHNEGYTVCYDSSSVAVFVNRDLKTEKQIANKMSLIEYATLTAAQDASKSPTRPEPMDRFMIYEYTAVGADGKEYTYFTVLCEANVAFWEVQFVCAKKVYGEYKPYFIEWAKSITFA